MTLGSYAKNYNWSKYECPKAHGFLIENYNKVYTPKFDCCGTPLLALMTGLSAQYIDRRKPKNRLFWRDASICKFLRQKGFTIIPITKFGVTNIEAKGEWWDTPINEKHVLLCNLLMCREEASWWLIHQGFAWHNWEAIEISALLLINKPSQSIFLVCHKSWR